MRNAAARGVCIAAVLVIEVLFIKYVVSKFGAVVFGIIALSSNVVSIATVLSIATVTTIGRFVADEYYKNNHAGASTAYIAGLSLICTVNTLLGIIFFVLYINFDSFFNVTPEILNESKNLFAGTALSFITSMLSGGLSVGMYVRNRLDLTDKFNLLRTILSRGLSVGLISAGYGFQSIGIGLVTSALIVLIMFYHAGNRIAPDLILRFSAFSLATYKAMARFGFWIAVRQIGSSVIEYADILLANLMLTLGGAGHYAIAVFFSTKIRMIGSAFSSLLNPTISFMYARGDTQGLLRFLKNAIKWIGLILSLPIGIICASYPEVLQYWFGVSISSLNTIAAISTVHLASTSAAYIVLSALTISNNVRIQGYTMASAATGFLLTAIALTKFTQEAAGFGIIIPLTIVTFLAYAFCLPRCCERALSFPTNSLVKPLVISTTSTVLVFTCMRILKWVLGCHSLPQLITPAILTSTAFLSTIFLCLTEEEKGWVVDYVKARFHQ